MRQTRIDVRVGPETGWFGKLIAGVLVLAVVGLLILTILGLWLAFAIGLVLVAGALIVRVMLPGRFFVRKARDAKVSTIQIGALNLRRPGADEFPGNGSGKPPAVRNKSK